MLLATYLARGEAAPITLGEFARRIGAHNARTVQRYVKHGRVPSGKAMARIVQATNGHVQPADFIEAANNS